MREPPGRGAQYRSKMRAVGMLRTGFILVFLIITYANTLPLQYLPSIPGYVPVYIRNGDEPLEDINLALAEAFAEHSSSKIFKDSNVVLEVEQPVDYELISNAQDEGSKNTESDEVTDKKSEDLVEVLRLEDDGVTPMQRRETNRSNLQKKSEAVTLEVNRSRIPQLLTAQEHEDEQVLDSDVKTEKPHSIPMSEETAVEVSSVTVKEKDDLDKPTTDVEKSSIKPNELIDPNPNYPELPAEIPQQHNSQDFGSSVDNHQDVGPTIVSLQDEPHDESEQSEEGSSSSSSESTEDSVENDNSSLSVSSKSNESK